MATKGPLRWLTLLLLAAMPLAGCGEKTAQGTANGVKFQITGAAVGKTKLHMDGTKLFINDNYYGTALAGDTVVVSDSGVTVNGTARSKETGS